MNLHRSKNRMGDRGRTGSALLYALVIAVALGGLCVALLSVNLGTQRRRVHDQDSQRAFYAAEAGVSDAFMQLSEGLMVVTNGVPGWVGTPVAPVQLGPSSYWVEVNKLDTRSYSLASTGIDGPKQERMELLLSEKPTGFFQFAAFGADGVVLDSNAFIDSFDSALGSYDSQVNGGNDFAKENGSVGSNDDILLKANTEVHGDVSPGPGHVVDDSAPNVYISGSTDPLEEEFEFPPITVPPVASSGSMVGTSNVVLGPGTIHYDSILMKGGSKLTIMGPAQLVAGDFVLKSNAELVFDASAGPIELYALDDFLLESNSRVKTLSDSALDVTLYLDGNNTTSKPPDLLELGSNSEFVGAIYAPNAWFKLGSNFSIYGSIMCGVLDLSSFGTIHFDEALLYDGPGSTDELEPVLWRPLPRL